MPLRVYTARLSPKIVDKDLLDITRMTADKARTEGRRSPGEIFAPSKDLLGQGLRRLRAAEETLERAIEQEGLFGSRELAAVLREQAAREKAEAWAWYKPRFVVEMKASYKANKSAWRGYLARERVVFACVCEDPACCHRSVVEACFGAMGAEMCGELGRG